MTETAPDDLKPGQYVAITYRHTDCDCCFCQSYSYDGAPLLIEAINFPFVLVFDGAGSYAIDIRYTKLIKLSRSYVNACLSCDKIPEPTNPHSDGKQTVNCCPRCSARMRQRFTESTWVLSCPECGLEVRTK